jgi:hypothetical protein
MDLAHFKCFMANQRRNYRVNWARYFKKFLTYKQPYLINGEPFNHIDDELDYMLGETSGNDLARRMKIDSDSDREEPMD